MKNSFIPVGDTLSREWVLSGVGGTLIDLDGCTANFFLASACGTLLFQASSPGIYLQISDPKNGVVKLSIPPDITSGWALPYNGVLRCFATLQIQYTDGSAFTEELEEITITRKSQSVSLIGSPVRSIVVGKQGPAGPPGNGEITPIGYVQGVYNAATNSPVISSGSGEQGDAYVVGVGNSSINPAIDGITSLNAGDTLLRGAAGWGVIKAKSAAVVSASGAYIQGYPNVIDAVRDGTGRIYQFSTSDESGVGSMYIMTAAGPDKLVGESFGPLRAADNLSDVSDTTTAVENLGLATPGAYVPGYPGVIDVMRDSAGRIYEFAQSGARYIVGPNGPDKIVTASQAPDNYVSGGAWVAGYGLVQSATVTPDGRAVSFMTATGTEYIAAPSGPYVPSASTGALNFDVVIYGGTIAGLMALVRAKRQFGLRVCILEPTDWWGGASGPGGLTFVDTPSTAGLIGGDTYNTWFGGIVSIDGSAAHRYLYEPKTGIKLANQIAATADLSLTRVRINGPQDLVMNSNAIAGVVTPQGIITGKQFIDASYECDLGVAALGASAFVLGREAASTASPANGYQPTSQHAYTVADNTLWPVVADPLETTGQADSLVQSWGMRGVMTRLAGNYVPFAKPDYYDNSHFAIQLQIWAANGITQFMRQSSTSVGWQGNLPNSKLAVNAFDLPNRATTYCQSNWNKRDQLVKELADYHAGLMYCIQSDPIMVTYGLSAMQTDAQGIGFCSDEFLGSPYDPGVPFTPYLREGYRLKAAKILTQTDVQNGTAQATSIAKYAYALDYHNGRWFAKTGTTTTVVNDGFPQISGTSAVTQIPAESLMQAAGGCPNLLVPMCFGADHIAWGPLRLEPLFGMTGEAAGVIASLAAQSGATVQSYNYAQVSAALTARGSVL